MSRFVVQFTIEGEVEVFLPSDATQAQITEVARKAVYDETAKSRGMPPGELVIGQYEGPV